MGKADFHKALKTTGTVHTTGSTKVMPNDGLSPPGIAQVPELLTTFLSDGQRRRLKLEDIAIGFQVRSIDGGQVVHPIYLTTERITYPASRSQLDNSYNTRDSKSLFKNVLMRS